MYLPKTMTVVSSNPSESEFVFDGIPVGKVDLPKGESGDFTIQSLLFQGNTFPDFDIPYPLGDGVPTFYGIYTELRRGDVLLMSDIPYEMASHIPLFRVAQGNVLLTGLGIGLSVQECLKKKWVERVTVIERELDVIHLVGTTLKERYGNRLEIIHANAWDWKPPSRVMYDVVWHDIGVGVPAYVFYRAAKFVPWATGNFQEAKELHKRYSSIAKLQMSWLVPNGN